MRYTVQQIVAATIAAAAYFGTGYFVWYIASPPYIDGSRGENFFGVGFIALLFGAFTTVIYAFLAGSINLNRSAAGKREDQERKVALQSRLGDESWDWYSAQQELIAEARQVPDWPKLYRRRGMRS